MISQVLANKAELSGLSTDVKPITNISTGSTYYELDTGAGWMYDSGNINPITGNGWWAI